jgi:hypothetical protein
MARDVAERELDQGGFPISNLGDPKAPGSATKTDNTTIPLADSGTGAPGKSLLAAPADHVHPAAVGAGGFMIMMSDPTEQAQSGPDETVIAEFPVDFPSLPPSNMAVTFGAVVDVDGGSATFNVRLGTHPNLVEGAVLATITTTSGTLELRTVTGAPFPPGTGPALLKITAANDNAEVACRIKSKTIALRSA